MQWLSKTGSTVSFSFDELRSIRVAYQVYEANDTKGMRIDATTLLRTLKVKRCSN